MSDVGAEWMPAWAIAAIAVSLVVAYALAAIRGEFFGNRAPVARVALVMLLALAGTAALESFRHRSVADERRALEARAFELTAHALMPGSALACLDAVASAAVEESCEKALFASPEATASAVSYVAAELSLLATAGEHARRTRTGFDSALTNLRRSLEADRFGIVAHVLATRDGCTPVRCAAFAFLQGSSRVSANLAARPFDRYLRSHMASWPAAGSAQVADNPPAPAAAPNAPALASAKQPNNLYFPSSSSIPPVSIMTAEPQSPNSTTGAAGPAPARKPTSPAPQTRQGSGATSAPAASSGPMQLAPGAQ